MEITQWKEKLEKLKIREKNHGIFSEHQKHQRKRSS